MIKEGWKDVFPPPFVNGIFYFKFFYIESDGKLKKNTYLWSPKQYNK